MTEARGLDQTQNHTKPSANEPEVVKPASSRDEVVLHSPYFEVESHVETIGKSSLSESAKSIDAETSLSITSSSPQGVKHYPETFRCGTVAIVGCPNVGKSTLLNSLIGQKISITSSKPQTTRIPVIGIATNDDAQYIFVDTPGYQTKHKSLLNTELNASVQKSLQGGIDVVLWVVEVNRYGTMDEKVFHLLPQGVPKILIISKIDQVVDKKTIFAFLKKMSELTEFQALIPVSAYRNTQLDVILTEIKKWLPIQPPIYPEEEVTLASTRFLAAEIIREKIFRLTGDELPYGCTVEVEEWEESPNRLQISVVVLVQREGHKPMLLGKKGEKMKAIATQSRMDMEKLFERKVFLTVWVKVKADWTLSRS